jgi:DNA polymerase-3 subunit delta'
MSWDSIIGQRRAKATLRAALSSRRVPHAWLFTGAEGVGKDATAIEVAKVLRCESPLDNGSTACGVCHGCTTTAMLQNANVRFIFALPTGKGEDSRSDSAMLKLSDAEITLIKEQVALKATDPYHNISIPRAQQIKISSIREVKRDISFVATEEGWRVVIISEAHQMGEEAANAFLKTLEEPSSRTLLILTTSQRERMLPTILSRCQEIRFDLLTDAEIASELVARQGADRTNAQLLAKLAEGSYSRAVELLSGDLNQLRFDVVSFLRTALRRSPLALHAEIERLTSGGDRVQIERMLTLLALWLRDVLVYRLTEQEDAVVNRDQMKDIQSFNSRFARVPIDRLIMNIERSIRAIRSNAQIPLVFTVLAMRMEELTFQSQGEAIQHSKL